MSPSIDQWVVLYNQQGASQEKESPKIEHQAGDPLVGGADSNEYTQKHRLRNWSGD